MTQRVLLCLSHSIEEFQQLDLLTSLGYEVASIGGYIDPAHPHDPKRPALSHVPLFPEVKAAIDGIGSNDNLQAAQRQIPSGILDWLGDDGIIIYHHYLGRLFEQWSRLYDWKRGAPGRRIIWRSVGQSVTNNENEAVPFRAQGLERIAYSPKEQNIPGYCGHDALIRFWAEAPCTWTGTQPYVLNITQHLRQRDPYTNWQFWEAATADLPRCAIGPGSEVIGGPGEMPYEQMLQHLQAARVYLYTGTQPASYTLGLLEAMAVGVPIISIGPAWMQIFPYGPDLFEGHELVGLWSNSPEEANEMLVQHLDDPLYALERSQQLRACAQRLFGRDAVGAAWKAYLG